MAAPSTRGPTIAVLAGAAAAAIAAVALKKYLSRRKEQQTVSASSTAPSNAAATVSDEDKERAKQHVKFGNMCARNRKPEKALEHYAKWT